MRIVGGEFRGRSLAAPKTQAIRPTTDRSRESLFNILSHAYPDSLSETRVLDLFAGTGALGLEALSRGCRTALFVESGVEGRGLIQKNIETMGLQGRARLFRRDATKLGPSGTVGPFDLVFADPPYGKGLGDRALASAARGGWIADGALVVLEEEAAAEIVPGPAFALLEDRAFGDTHMHLFRYTVQASSGDEGIVANALESGPKS
ncbi:16S rRNA (guanine(966)-N(2))-methyltransferase RsmD [Hoeflea sp. G2-23]|uniref:16S rRNA (Guanine(966)-N(2))-methyltransferase RsmD n=1 Tax=Hoeflea algicola TaxID=2983763 RepID=A0ABT3ZG97_9HYPH|nr:16S rRNA (guanine(966)-N(2))-methyltransferase RsmD [Hoeflea algicola]MCY0150274.1 16S rRNA (guanine(966)-N(2))-methyltransferase RsmD [Hoeflea algicola]